MNELRLVLVCGLPGSGKTTLAKELEHSYGAVRFCPDEWLDDLRLSLWDESTRARIEALQWKLAQRLLVLGQTVIIEWGMWGQAEREALRQGARALGAAVELHYLAIPLETLFERIQKRGMEDPPIRWEQLQEWATSFQVPSPEELALYDTPVE